MTTERAYEGDELGLFAAACSWKSYWSGKLRSHLGKSVLEVGAGMGINTSYLCSPKQRKWVCLEPDPALAHLIPDRVAAHAWHDRVEINIGTLDDLPAEPTFDSLIYIDVLEHIENDKEELRNALLRLAPGDKIIVLSPAHQGLYTEFDRKIGHYRRYSKSSLRELTPPGARMQELYYLDSAGLLASLANRMLLHQSMPTQKQILFWDTWLVTASHSFLDRLTGFHLGKTVVVVWIKE